MALSILLGLLVEQSLCVTIGTAAEPGGQLRAADDDSTGAGGEHTSRPMPESWLLTLTTMCCDTADPLGMSFLRVLQGDCRHCLKECLGSQILSAQMGAAKVQAPLGLITWYLFRNRPFKMWPLEDAIGWLFKVNPAIYAGMMAGAYMSCRGHCEMDCPYPGGEGLAADTPPQLPELDEVNAEDLSFLSRLYQRGRPRGGGGAFSDAVSDLFRIV